MTRPRCQVVVVGAGPFGLAAVSHLRSAGIETRIFGQPMESWRRHMPAGMFIRTRWVASNIADPDRALTLDRCVQAGVLTRATPQPLADFITYGLWYQHHVAPDLDCRRVLHVEPALRGFRLLLEDGEPLEAQHVVVATGLTSLGYRPQQFQGLPPSRVSHTAEHSDLQHFAGQRIVVVGGGLSAFEFAVQLNEAGADVEVVMRARTLPWLHETRGNQQVSRAKQLYRMFMANDDGLVQRVVHPYVGVGPPPFSTLSAKPRLVSQLPRAWREWMNQWSLQRLINRGAEWFPARLTGVMLTPGREIMGVTDARDVLRLTLDDGTQRSVDHVLLATGYALDVARYQFLSRELIDSVRRPDGYPKLKVGLESSVPGLHFAGPITQVRFGPIMYSLGGTGYAARVLARSIVNTSREGDRRADSGEWKQVERDEVADVGVAVAASRSPTEEWRA
jgi:FAD-dependent urate hydroxylase